MTGRHALRFSKLRKHSAASDAVTDVPLSGTFSGYRSTAFALQGQPVLCGVDSQKWDVGGTAVGFLAFVDDKTGDGYLGKGEARMGGEKILSEPG
jgi:hypothetical protein